MKTIAVILTLALTLACSSSAFEPQVVVDETVCAECGMLVSDLGFSAVLQLADGSQKAFDDPVCLIRHVRSGESGPSKEAWFHASERWTRSSGVVFVQHKEVRGPMGGNVKALVDRNEANRMATTKGGAVITSYSDLLRIEDSGK